MRRLALSTLAMLLPLLAHAASISGKVLNMSLAAVPMSGVEITLLRGEATGPVVVGTMRSDAAGAFTFRRVKQDTSAIYRVQVTFAGLPQGTTVRVVGETIRANLAVFDTTSSNAAVVVERAHLIVQSTEAGTGVTAIYVMRNDGNIYIGAPADSGDGRKTIRFDMPGDPETLHFQALQGMMAMHKTMESDGFTSTMPFYPGRDTVIFGYFMPWSDGKGVRFNHVSRYPVESLNVVAMEGVLELDVEGATQEKRADMPQLMNMVRRGVPANLPVTITAYIAEPVSTAQWIIIVAFGVFIAIVVFAVYIRRQQQSERSEQRVAAEAVPVAEDGDVDVVVERIGELDVRFENDEIGPVEYVDERRRMKRELMRLLAEE
jgi:hypothetical protein